MGDYARVGGRGRPLPACYPWLLRGRLIRVIGIAGKIAGGHLEYRFASRHGRPQLRLASFDLRRPIERDRAPGGGRKRRNVVTQ